MSELLIAGDKAYIVSQRVREFVDWFQIPPEQFVELISEILWHDVHTDVVDVLAKTELTRETTTAGREAGWLLHELAREMRKDG